MTTATNTIIEFTPAQIAHRETCAFLKGILCGYADRKGHTYHTTKPRTAAFDAGFKIGSEDRLTRDDITAIHKTHNALRHFRPHGDYILELQVADYPAAMYIKKHLGDGEFALAIEQAEKDKAVSNG